MERLKQPIPVAYRDDNWLIVNKPYDCRIESYPCTMEDPSGKVMPQMSVPRSAGSITRSFFFH